MRKCVDQTRCNLSNVLWHSWFPYSCSYHLGIVSHSCVTLSTFRQHLKLIFSVQLPHYLVTHLSASNSLQPWHCINLLTYLHSFSRMRAIMVTGNLLCYCLIHILDRQREVHSTQTLFTAEMTLKSMQ